jgi:CO/xanthine dehydrogenase FAD-binding subunit
MVALGATLVLSARGGERRISAAEFFTGLFTTGAGGRRAAHRDRAPARPPESGFAFIELARRHGDYALVGVAATVTLGASGTCKGARIVLFSVGEGPVAAVQAAAALEGFPPDPKVIAAAAAAVQDDIDPPSDIHASAAYRRQLARVLTGRALERAVARARAHQSNPEQ